jgi:hypothetical protein
MSSRPRFTSASDFGYTGELSESMPDGDSELASWPRHFRAYTLSSERSSWIQDESRRHAGWIWQAAALFAVTNIDDIVVLSIFFGRTSNTPTAAARPWPGNTSASAFAGHSLAVLIGYVAVVLLLVGAWCADCRIIPEQ